MRRAPRPRNVDRMVLRRIVGALSAACMLPLTVIGAADARPSTGHEEGAVPHQPVARSDAHEPGEAHHPPLERLAKIQRWRGESQARLEQGAFRRGQGFETPPLGSRRQWAVLDTEAEVRYFREFTLAAVTDHAELWLASGQDAISRGLEYPAGDCRNDNPAATRVTAAHLEALGEAFEGSIRPRLRPVFGTPSYADGSRGEVFEQFPQIPRDAWGGDGDRTVVLLDNIRDPGFYNRGTPGGVLGYVLPNLRTWFDRHILVLDATWLDHRRGANPPPPSGACPLQGASPQEVESVFAHEYVHVLQNDLDRDWDFKWQFEGTADWGAAQTGLGAAARFAKAECLLGQWIGCDGGPENSLTVWGDRAHAIADYAAGHTLTDALAAAGGTRAVAEFVADERDGLASLRAVLGKRRLGTDRDLLRDWSTSLALGVPLAAGAELRGGRASSYLPPGPRPPLNWDTPAAYARPGAPPNGADFVRLRDAAGVPLDLAAVERVDVDGQTTYEPKPSAWRSVDGALHVAPGPTADDAVVREVMVPAADPTLTFRTRYELEPRWDFGFVQVSTDGGATYQSVPAHRTTAEHEQLAAPEIVAQLPGFTGESGGWVDERVDLSAYAGQTVLVSFRAMTDQFVELGGWWIDDVVIGGTVVADGSTLDGWRRPEEIRPRRVASLGVRIVGHTDDGKVAFLKDVVLDGDLDGSITGAELRRVAGRNVEMVGAIVTHYEPSEFESRPARYALRVNGVVQSGG